MFSDAPPGQPGPGGAAPALSAALHRRPHAALPSPSLDARMTARSSLWDTFTSLIHASGHTGGCILHFILPYQS